MAYGAIVEVEHIRVSTEELESLVDVRDNRKGTLQWVILASSVEPSALGVHTWIEGYLSPVYRGVLRRLADSGYEVGSVCRGKDRLMEALTTAADLHTAVRTFGLKRSMWQEFDDKF
jgi:hypothetical protein